MQDIKKKRAIYAAVQVLIAAALVGGIGYSYMSADRKAPEILLPEGDTVLSGSVTDEMLVHGVLATDDVDADVSDTLKVESVTRLTDDQVLVVYAAKDKSNNVSTLARTAAIDTSFLYDGLIETGGGMTGGAANESDLEYPADSGVAGRAESEEVIPPVDAESIPAEHTTPDDTESVAASQESVVPNTESAAGEIESASEEAESSVPETMEESGSDNGAAENAELTYDSEISTEDTYKAAQFVDTEKDPSSFTESDISDLNERLRNANNISISRLPDGYPVIRLNTYAVKKSASESFQALGYISDIRDDVDLSSDIFGRISVSGNTGLDQPGIYTVNYYVTDSDGQRSNVAHLMVIVTK